MTIKIDYFDTRYELIINNKGKHMCQGDPIGGSV